MQIVMVKFIINDIINITNYCIKKDKILEIGIFYVIMIIGFPISILPFIVAYYKEN